MKLRTALLCLFLIFQIGCESSDPDPLENKPTIFGLGVSMSTIPLTHDDQEQLFVEFGMPSDDGEFAGKLIAHPEFYMPIGNLVTAVSEGKVRDIFELDGPDDVLVMVTPDDAPQWTIGYEHVSNVAVSIGDRVSVGDVIAEISPDNSQYFQGYGKTALMIFVDSGKASTKNLTYCPFMLLDPSVSEGILEEVRTHVRLWEENKGREDIFDESRWIVPGCYEEHFKV